MGRAGAVVMVRKADSPYTDMRKTVFLDRDSVLNDTVIRGGQPSSPRELSEFRIVPEAKQALTSLREAEYLLIVATNQPEVARRLLEPAVIELMHQKLRACLPLDDIRVCSHDDHHKCGCRKPAPGLLLNAAKDWGISLDESYIIGDRLKDVKAGRCAGCKTIFLRYPYNERNSESADYTATSLLDATEWILGASK
jgi:D-glycero-D-manno-heptose 1,7-bisphosphate phosphatase